MINRRSFLDSVAWALIVVPFVGKLFASEVKRVIGIDAVEGKDHSVRVIIRVDEDWRYTYFNEPPKQINCRCRLIHVDEKGRIIGGSV